MAPELINSLDAAELRQLALQVRDYQERKKLSDNAMLKKFPGLGSTKTYTRILKNELLELDLEKQLARYRTVALLVENLGDSEGSAEPLYDDLSPAVWLKSAFLDVMHESGDARFVLMLGDSGAGKTSARRILVDAFGERVRFIEAVDPWGDSPMAMLGEMLRVLGEKNPPYNQVVRLRKVVELLTGGSRVCFIIDEGHHLGPRCLNTIKTLINQTPGEFVVLALYSLWRKLEREAYEEVKQLTGNRLALRIQLALAESDIRLMLDRRLQWANGDVEKAVTLLREKAPKHGNLAFVREVCKQVNELAAGEPVTFEVFCSGLAAKGASR